VRSTCLPSSPCATWVAGRRTRSWKLARPPSFTSSCLGQASRGARETVGLTRRDLGIPFQMGAEGSEMSFRCCPPMSAPSSAESNSARRFTSSSLAVPTRALGLTLDASECAHASPVHRVDRARRTRRATCAGSWSRPVVCRLARGFPGASAQPSTGLRWPAFARDFSSLACFWLFSATRWRVSQRLSPRSSIRRGESSCSGCDRRRRLSFGTLTVAKRRRGCRERALTPGLQRDHLHFVH
jgi:hypothetical protein